MTDPGARHRCYEDETSWVGGPEGKPSLARDASGVYWGGAVEILWQGFAAGCSSLNSRPPCQKEYN